MLHLHNWYNFLLWLIPYTEGRARDSVAESGRAQFLAGQYIPLVSTKFISAQERKVGRPGCEADFSSPSSIKTKNGGAKLLIPHQ
jgi:hypothetical protein